MDVLTKDVLFNEYIVEKKTYVEIAEKYGCDSTYIGLLNKKYGYSKEMWYKSFELNSFQHDLVIGGILGDGCVTKQKKHKYHNYYECHAENQKEYLGFKFNLMSNLCKMTDIKLRTGNGYNVQPLYYFVTRNLPCLDKYKELSTYNTLESLNENSFIIWLMDDAVFYKSPDFCRLGFTRFTLEETEQAIEIIYKKFNIKGIVNWKDKEHTILWGITFRKNETRQIFDVLECSEFSNEIKKTMSYKMPK